jgi:hypothetical protein
LLPYLEPAAAFESLETPGESAAVAVHDGQASYSTIRYNVRVRELADRAGAVTGYCLSIKASHADVLHVVGVATSPTDHRMHSEDVVHVDATQWTAELQAMAERVKAESGFYTAPTARRSCRGSAGALRDLGSATREECSEASAAGPSRSAVRIDQVCFKQVQLSANRRQP